MLQIFLDLWILLEKNRITFVGQKYENMLKHVFWGLIWNLPEVFVENAEKTNTNRQCMGQLGQNYYPCSTNGLNFEKRGLHGNGCI